MRAVVLALVLLIGACKPYSAPPVVATPPAPVQAAPVTAAVAEPAAPLPEAIAEVSDAVTVPLQDAVASLATVIEVEPPPAVAKPLVTPAAVAAIVRFEITSPAYYTKKLIRPIWPRGASGVTWCIGYDGGHQTRHVIAEDWWQHPDVLRLAETAGVTGTAAQAILPKYRDIVTAYPYCEKVFAERTLIQYHRQTRRWLREGFDELRPNAQGSMVMLVYNRGSSTVGDSRREMKQIQQCVRPPADYPCIAGQLRSMTRLWKGTKNENGLAARREVEARLVETE